MVWSRERLNIFFRAEIGDKPRHQETWHCIYSGLHHKDQTKVLIISVVEEFEYYLGNDQYN